MEKEGKMMKYVFGVLSMVVVGLPSLALAQEVLETPPEGFDLFPALVEAAQGGKWSIFVSLILMALVWLATKAPILSDLIKGEAKVWVAAVAGILGGIGATALTTGDWVGAVLGGLSVGLSATGLYELVKRAIKGQAIDKDGDGVLDDLSAGEPPKSE